MTETNISTYETVDGTEPSIDEQHEARTVRRDRQEGSYMMSEIGDGVFVQWSDCRTCKQLVEACKCANGPTEPEYIHRWRINRFVDSFKGRGTEPALPVALKDRDRRVNGVIRYLLELGYSIVAPQTKSDIPDYDDKTYDSDDKPAWQEDLENATAYLEAHDPEGPDGWIKDFCEHCEAGSGELCHDGKGNDLKEPHKVREQAWSARRGYEANPGDYQGEIKPEWVKKPETDEVSEKVDAGMGNALETLRARAQGEDVDAGF